MDTHLYESKDISLFKSAHVGFPIDGMGKGKKTFYLSYQ